MIAKITPGLPDHLREPAAHLYWQAFGSKLSRVLGPEDRAVQFLRSAIMADHCMTATDSAGRLCGVAGFRTAQGSFAGGNMVQLRASYGNAGAAWRSAVLRRLEHGATQADFLLDGICVDAKYRNQGIGSALVKAVEDEARRRGHTALYLDVVDTNRRARALYSRRGYTVVKVTPIGWLRHLFGFTAALTMVKDLG